MRKKYICVFVCVCCMCVSVTKFCVLFPFSIHNGIFYYFFTFLYVVLSHIKKKVDKIFDFFFVFQKQENPLLILYCYRRCKTCVYIKENILATKNSLIWYKWVIFQFSQLSKRFVFVLIFNSFYIFCKERVGW